MRRPDAGQCIGWLFGLAIALGGTAWAQLTQRISVNSNGVQGNAASEFAVITPDGRYVALESNARNLVPGDGNGWQDVFVRDRRGGSTERVSIASNGTQADRDCLLSSISADGRYVAFVSWATTLVPGDTNASADVFVRDRQAGVTERVSVATGGAQGNGNSIASWISADGRYVSFTSDASNLVPGDTNGTYDVFVRDRRSGTTERVSIDSGGLQGNADSYLGSMSPDGRYVAFASNAWNLVAGDTNLALDSFIHDRRTGVTERVSVATGGVQGNGDSNFPSISSDGRFVAFWSHASNLVPADSNGTWDVFVHDRQSSVTERVSVNSNGREGNAGSYNPSISADGRFVAFWSYATNLVPGDTNGHTDVFVRDRQSATTARMSVDSSGIQGNGDSGSGAAPGPFISADGRYVVFESASTNLVPGDTNHYGDVFLRDLLGGPSFTSLCDPGAGGVIPCPCANPPGGSGLGCDNSSGTGGASLSASGGAYLSSDSLVFTTSGERPTATSILLQGSALAASGVVYGQGVRCVGGVLKRLYTKTAVGGSVTAPDFGAGDPTVSARSAAKGDVIQPGQDRWYLVYYRDLTVLGGCPASSTFNATQTGQLSWWP